MDEIKESRRGLAATKNITRRSEIAAMGGRAIPAEKRSFSKDRKLAAEAGRKGGLARKGKKYPRKKRTSNEK